MTVENTKIINLNVKKEERVLDFSDFQKQEIKFDISKLQEAYNQIIQTKKFEDAGVTHFGAIPINQIPNDESSIKGNNIRGSSDVAATSITSNNHQITIRSSTARVPFTLSYFGLSDTLLNKIRNTKKKTPPMINPVIRLRDRYDSPIWSP